MTTLYQKKTYLEDLDAAIRNTVAIEQLKNSRVFVTGATGLIGSFLVDVLMRFNETENADVVVYALSRRAESLRRRFDPIKDERLIYVESDVAEISANDFEADYVVHAASGACPAVFCSDPVGVIKSNVVGTLRLLEASLEKRVKRALFVSSGEVYGTGDVSLDSYDESYCGKVDSTSPRSCYPNGKRVAETLCASFSQQFGLETIVVRPSHTYGPTATSSDNRAHTQFIRQVISGQDITMYSAGTQMRSYTYVADCVSGLLTTLLNGRTGEAYNIAVPSARVTIAQFAQILAGQSGRRVQFVVPDAESLKGATPIPKQVLDSAKLESLGWVGQFDVESGIRHTLAALNDNQ